MKHAFVLITLLTLLVIYFWYRGFYIWPEFGKDLEEAPLRTRSDSKPFVEDILGIILLLQLLESRIILTKQGFSFISNTVFFLRTMV
jgi:hypothetical protein